MFNCCVPSAYQYLFTLHLSVSISFCRSYSTVYILYILLSLAAPFSLYLPLSLSITPYIPFFYLCISISLCILPSISLYISLFLSTYISLQSTSPSVYLYFTICIPLFLYTYISLYLPFSIYCTYIFLHLPLSIYISFFYLLYIFLHLHLSIYISLYLLLFIYISHTCSLFLSMYLCPTVSHPPTHYPHIHIVCGNCMEPRAQKYLHAGISQYNFAQILAFSTTWVFMCYTGEHHHHIHAQDTLHMC